VGNESYLRVLEHEYLKNLLKFGASFKLVQGYFGAGKTHFLHCVRDLAWRHGFVTALVELSPAECPYDDSLKVYRAVARRIAMLRLADQIALVNESQLDSGKQQVARTFAEFRRRLAGTAALTVGLGLLLALFSVRKILELEREAAVRFREIANTRTELKQLSARLVDIQENERRTISRELHDEVGQALSAALVEMGNLSAAIRAGDEASLPGHVEAVKKLVENCVAVVRNMALLLRPSMLDDLGLVPALQWQAREVSKRTGMRVRVAAEHVSDDLSEEHKTCIYRVVQEALHNCARHASAQMVRVNVRQEPGRILLSVYDDGKGFEPQARGMGLLGIEERVTNLGGRFEIHAAPGQGTSLQIVLPLAGAAVAAAQQVTS
jgi:signal transduction histidine kinase